MMCKPIKPGHRQPYNDRAQLRGTLRLLAVGAAVAMILQADAALPKGVILNLDFQNIEEGLIPNKTLYPLHVPLGDLGTEIANNRRVIVIDEEQHLDIPHSSLLDPDGSGWVATIRVFALTDGMVMSQSSDERGYAIYIRDGAVEVAVQTSHSTLYLKEAPEAGITPCLNTWMTIELIIKPDVALLILNRAHVALVTLNEPLAGKDSRIRIGRHDELPAPLARNQTVSLEGFTGAISSVKILRQ